MKLIKIGYVFLVFFWVSLAFAQPVTPPMEFTQEDGTDSVYPYKVQVDHTASTDGSTVTISLGTGGGDNVTVNSTAVDTTANIKDSTDITWTLTDGGAGGPDDVAGAVADKFIKLVGDTTGAMSEDLNLDSDTFVISYDDDKVGIGTAAPGTALDIQSGSSADQLRMGSSSNYFKVGRDTTTGGLTFEGTQSGARNFVFLSGNVGIGDTTPATALTVGDGDLFQVASTGQVSFVGTGIPKKRVYISATAGLSPTTTGCADAAQTELGTTDINRINVMTCDFDASSDEYWIAHFTLPENYDGGTFTAAVSWTCTADAAKGVAWFIQLLGMSSGDVMGATDFGTAVEMNDDGETTNDYLLTAESGAITENHAGGSGTTVGGDELWIKLYRDVSDADDDLTTDAKFIGLWLTFGIDALSTED